MVRIVSGQQEALLKRSARFWPNIGRSTESGCWLWAGCLDPSGYGRLGGRLVHRFAYNLMCGDIADGAEIDHLCAIRNCVNPVHMQVVPHGFNAKQGRTKRAKMARATTHCARGHEFTPENTRLKKKRDSIQRMCRECSRAAGRIIDRKRRRKWSE